MASDLQVRPFLPIRIPRALLLRGRLCPPFLQGTRPRFNRINKVGRNTLHTPAILRARHMSLRTKANTDLTIMVDMVTHPRISRQTVLHHLHPPSNRRPLTLHHPLQSHMLPALITTHRSVLHPCTVAMERRYPVQLLQDRGMHSPFLRPSNSTHRSRPKRDPSRLHREAYHHGLRDNRRHLEQHLRMLVRASNNFHQTNRMITVRNLNRSKAFNIVPLTPFKAHKFSPPILPCKVNLHHYKRLLLLHTLQQRLQFKRNYPMCRRPGNPKALLLNRSRANPTSHSMITRLSPSHRFRDIV